MRGWMLGLLALLTLTPVAAADPLQDTLLMACGELPSSHPVDFSPLREIPFQRDFFEALEDDLEDPQYWCESNARNIHSPV